MIVVERRAPEGDAVVDYDRCHLALYAALLEAADAGRDWQEAATSPRATRSNAGAPISSGRAGSSVKAWLPLSPRSVPGPVRLENRKDRNTSRCGVSSHGVIPASSPGVSK